MSDIMTETPEETAAMTAMREETAPPAEQTPAPEPVAPPTPAAQPEPAPPAPVAQQPAAPPQPPARMVPHQALHEERERRIAAERRIAELQKPAPHEDVTPDEQTDPLGAIAALKAEMRQIREREQRVSEEQAYIRDLGARVGARINAYAAEHPEYVDQMQYLRQSRAQELKLLGRSNGAIVQQITREEMALGQMALDQDLDPGEVIANLAKHRGWQAKDAVVVAPAPAPTPAPVPAPVPQAAPASPSPAEQRIERLQKGQKAAVSSSSAGGGGPSPEMTLEQLAALEGAAFDQAFAKHGKRLMGG